MGFIDYNANIGLFALIIIVAGIAVGLTVFYQLNFKDINHKYDTKIQELNKTFEKLIGTQDVLNQTKEELDLKAKREEDLSGKYTSTKQQKERLQGENADLSKNLANTRAQVDTLKAQIDQLNLNINSLQATISDLTSQKNSQNTIINCFRSAAPNANC